MRKILTLLAILVGASANEINAVDGPFLLDDESFFKNVIDADTYQAQSDKSWFVLFYAPWCEACKKWRPVLDQLYLRNKNKLHVGKVDCASKDSS